MRSWRKVRLCGRCRELTTPSHSSSTRLALTLQHAFNGKTYKNTFVTRGECDSFGIRQSMPAMSVDLNKQTLTFTLALYISPPLITTIASLLFG